MCVAHVCVCVYRAESHHLQHARIYVTGSRRGAIFDSEGPRMM